MKHSSKTMNFIALYCYSTVLVVLLCGYSPSKLMIVVVVALAALDLFVLARRACNDVSKWRQARSYS